MLVGPCCQGHNKLSKPSIRKYRNRLKTAFKKIINLFSKSVVFLSASLPSVATISSPCQVANKSEILNKGSPHKCFISEFKSIAFSVYSIIIIAISSLFISVAQVVADPIHTISKQIPSPEAMDPGFVDLEIPFATLDGSLKFSGEITEDFTFILNDLSASQKITVIDSLQNIVSFFTDSTETPLLFKIIEATKDSIKLEPLDSLAAWREITLANNNAIKGTLTNSSPYAPVNDTNLAKWNTIIEKVDASKGESPSVFNIKFERNTPFLASDTLYLPFNQMYLEQEMVRGAVIGIKIIEQMQFSRAAYNYKQCGWCYPRFLFQDTLVGPSLDFKIQINDKENKNYDNLLWNGYMGGGFNATYRPLNLIYPIVNAKYTWFKNDPPRVNMTNGFDGAFGENEQYLPDSVWFMAGSTPRIRGPPGDTIRFSEYTNLKWSFSKTGGLEIGDKLYTLDLVKSGTSYVIKDNSFIVWEKQMVDGKPKSVIIGSTPSFQDYFGVNGEISSKDSITFMPTDSKFMAKLLFKATNNYQKGNPYKDTIIPLIINNIPLAGEKNVNIESTIYAKFDGMLDTNQFDNYTLNLKRLTGKHKGYVPGHYSYNSEDFSLTFFPNSLLAYETDYEVKFWRVFDVAGNMLTEYSYTFTTEQDTSVGVNENSTENNYLQIYPNPSQNIAKIEYTINNSSDVHLLISNITGSIFKEFDLGEQAPGEHIFNIDTKDLPQGMYFIKLIAGEKVETGKMVVVE